MRSNLAGWTRAYRSAERDAALLMAGSVPGTHRVTLGADKGYDARNFTTELRHMEITPHIAQNDTNRRSAVDGRTTRHAGYQLSQKKAYRRSVWLDEMHWPTQESPASRAGTGWLDVHLHGRGLQLDAHSEPETWRATAAVYLNAQQPPQATAPSPNNY